jgi:hypothetical protein
LKELKFLDLEQNTPTTLPLVDDSQEEIFGVFVHSHHQQKIHIGIPELLLILLGFSSLLLLFKGIFVVA